MSDRSGRKHQVPSSATSHVRHSNSKGGGSHISGSKGVSGHNMNINNISNGMIGGSDLMMAATMSWNGNSNSITPFTPTTTTGQGNNAAGISYNTNNHTTGQNNSNLTNQGNNNNNNNNNNNMSSGELFSRQQGNTPSVMFAGPKGGRMGGGSYTSPTQITHGQGGSVPGQTVQRGQQDTGFPSTPYQPTQELFMREPLRHALGNTLVTNTQQGVLATGVSHNSNTSSVPLTSLTVMEVASKVFDHYLKIYNLEWEPLPSSVPALRGVRTQAHITTNKYSSKETLLRRIVGYKNTPEHSDAVFERLRFFRHPNLVSLQRIKTTDEFQLGSKDCIVEYRYVKGARSLQDAFLSSSTRRDPNRNAEVATEGLMWSIACQLIGLIRSFHQVDVPVGGLHSSKIIYFDETSRVMFTGLGLQQLVNSDTAPLTGQLLQEAMSDDIIRVGEILYQLTTRSIELPIDDKSNNNNNNNRDRPIRNRLQCTAHCSSSFAHLVNIMMSGNVSIAGLCEALGERLSQEVGHQSGHTDYLLHQLQKTIHCDRLMRLVVKLNMIIGPIIDSNDAHHDPDRAVARLFFNYVFHQVDESHRPRLDWGHAFHTLNKLDCGSDDIIQMISTDASTILVMSFADIKLSLERRFEKLRALEQGLGPNPTPPGVSDAMVLAQGVMGSSGIGHSHHMGGSVGMVNAPYDWSMNRGSHHSNNNVTAAAVVTGAQTGMGMGMGAQGRGAVGVGVSSIGTTVGGMMASPTNIMMGGGMTYMPMQHHN